MWANAQLDSRSRPTNALREQSISAVGGLGDTNAILIWTS